MSQGALQQTQEMEIKRVAQEVVQLQQAWQRKISHALDSQDTWTFLYNVLHRAQSKTISIESRDLLLKTAKQMLQQAKEYAMICGGEIVLPLEDDRPNYRALEKPAMRIVNTFLGLDPWEPKHRAERGRMAILYGPAGSGKTVVAQLIAYEIRQKLVNAFQTDFKRLNDVGMASELLPKFVTVYYVDAMIMRSSPPETWPSKLKSILTCMNYVAKFEKVLFMLQQNPDSAVVAEPLSIFILDNFETFFMDTIDLHHQPRPARESQQIVNFKYRSLRQGGRTRVPPPPALPTKKQTRNKTMTTMYRRVGGAEGTAITSMTKSSMTVPSWVKEQLSSMFQQSALVAQFPRVRIILNARYPWEIPTPIWDKSLEENRIFIDLPIRAMRQYYLGARIQNIALTNVFMILKEAATLRKEALFQKNLVVPDNNQTQNDRYMNKHDALMAYLRKQFTPSLLVMQQAELQVQLSKNNGRYVEANGSTKAERMLQQEKDLVLRLLSDVSIFHPLMLGQAAQKFEIKSQFFLMNSPNALKKHIDSDPGKLELKAAWDRFESSYVELVADLVERTGMSAIGECELEDYIGSDLFKTYQSLTDRTREGPTGQTANGFTLEELEKFVDLLKEQTQSRLLKESMNAEGAYIVDASSKYRADACVLVAPKDINPNNVMGCKYALGQDLRDIKTDLPIVSVWTKFGSNLITPTDVETVFNGQIGKERRTILTNKQEYLQLIAFMLTKNKNRVMGPLRGQSSREAYCRKAILDTDNRPITLQTFPPMPRSSSSTTTTSTMVVAPEVIENVEFVRASSHRKKKKHQQQKKPNKIHKRPKSAGHQQVSSVASSSSLSSSSLSSSSSAPRSCSSTTHGKSGGGGCGHVQPKFLVRNSKSKSKSKSKGKKNSKNTVTKRQFL